MYVENYKVDYNCLILAFEKGEAVGFIFGYLKYKSGEFCHYSTGHIDALFVKENYRNQGIATRLIEKYINWSNT